LKGERVGRGRQSKDRGKCAAEKNTKFSLRTEKRHRIFEGGAEIKEWDKKTVTLRWGKKKSVKKKMTENEAREIIKKKRKCCLCKLE